LRKSLILTTLKLFWANHCRLILKSSRMKKIWFVPAALVIGMITLASCSSGRYYERDYGYGGPPPPPRSSVSLIINAGPGYPVSRYSDGRYYYRAPNGYMYWRGAGNRYYLDRRYVNRSYHNSPQYRDWNRGHGRRR
jgi:hypothetical protein